MKIPKLAHAVAAAAFILGTVPLTFHAPSVIAQQMRLDKPGKPRPDEPHGDGCVPIGVTKSPSTGIVYADEDCHGKIYRSRMN